MAFVTNVLDVDLTEEPFDAESVDLAAEYARSEVPQILDKLDRELVGLQPVKEAIHRLAALLLVDRVRRDCGLTANFPGLHMAFMGKPGTGKTTVAMRMADILHRLGYIQKGHLVVADRDALAGPRARAAVEKALGGVLFIDEAYYLHSSEDQSFSGETIEVLLQAMENRRHELVVIVAGYRDRMSRFFNANPGLASRIDHHITFPDFTDEELLAIGKVMLERQYYRFTPEAEEAFMSYISRCRKLPYFANARSMRGAVDEFRMRQANRMFVKMGTRLTRGDLQTIEAEDVLQSPVFMSFL